MSKWAEPTSWPRRLFFRIRTSPRWQTVANVLYGMFLYETHHTLRRQRGDLESLFVLVMFGDMVGIPILPPYYSLRLLPFTVPYIGNWKNRLLRERDITDLIG